MLHALAMALWITIPVALGGLIHVIIIKLRLMPGLAAMRLDFGATYNGQPVFGENKTWRGALVMPLATAGCVWLQISLSHDWRWADSLAISFQQRWPIVWGILAGAGYIAGELPNSFIKRQLGIRPGETAENRSKWAWWTVDQVDSLSGVILFLLPVWTPSLLIVGSLLAVAILVHPLIALVMYCLGLKTRVG